MVFQPGKTVVVGLVRKLERPCVWVFRGLILRFGEEFRELQPYGMHHITEGQPVSLGQSDNMILGLVPRNYNPVFHKPTRRKLSHRRIGLVSVGWGHAEETTQH